MQATPFQLPACLKGLRQLIETVNGQLVERFKVRSMRVRKGWTLVAKWYRKILAHTVCVWLNLQFGRSPLDFAGLVSVKYSCTWRSLSSNQSTDPGLDDKQ